MLREARRRFSRAELALFTIPLLVPVLVKAGVAFEEWHNHYPIWDNVMGKLIPSRNKPCCGGMKQIGLGVTQKSEANQKVLK